jgi:hypothetical protein
VRMLKGDHRLLHGYCPPRRGQVAESAGEAAVKDAEGAAERGAGDPKCAAFLGTASLTGASSWLVGWRTRDDVPSLRRGSGGNATPAQGLLPVLGAAMSEFPSGTNRLLLVPCAAAANTIDTVPRGKKRVVPDEI